MGSEHVVAIVSTKQGLEQSLCSDVMNVALTLFMKIDCKPVDKLGLSLILSYSEVDSIELAKKLAKRYIRGFWVIPVERVCRASYEDVAKHSLDLILVKNFDRYPLKILGKCRKRGNYIDSCSSLLRYIGNYIESVGVAEVDFDNYEHVLRIEIIEDRAYISIYAKNEEEMFRVGRGLGHQ